MLGAVLAQATQAQAAQAQAAQALAMGPVCFLVQQHCLTATLLNAE